MSRLDQSIVGLAGHIDHGKTSIVKALTGTNTDNLKEELHRGMTINIGFAFLDDNITLIDVPGHEKFIKNMVVGVSAIDYALLVIAADDGIMPQTLEHFEILKLFGVKDGAIIINKIDKVENDWISLVENEINNLVKGTFLDGKKIYKTDALNGIGIDDLKNDLLSIKSQKYKKDSEIFRMFIDRIFTSKGFGTVVTGTIASGKISVGQKIKILPQNKVAKVRGIETHKHKVDELTIGKRAAINLQFKDKIFLNRGNHLSQIDYFSVYEEALVSVSILSKSDKPVKNNERLRFYLGTQEVMARILFYNNKLIEPGESTGAILKFERPIICSIKDKFIIRRYSPLVTIGGGEILDFNLYEKWHKNKIYINEIYNLNSINRITQIIQKQHLKPFTYSSLGKYMNLSKDKLLKSLEDERIQIIEDNWIVTKKQFENIIDEITIFFRSFHEKNPYSNGMIKDVILNSLIIETSFLDFLLDFFNKKNKLKFLESKWSLMDFNISLTKKELETNNKIINIIDSKGFNAISIKELNDNFIKDYKLISKMIEIEISNKVIILIDGSLLFSKNNIDKLSKIVKDYFTINNTLNVKEFKELTNTSRKYAVPLLEYFDKIGLTYRVGNERKYKK